MQGSAEWTKSQPWIGYVVMEPQERKVGVCIPLTAFLKLNDNIWQVFIAISIITIRGSRHGLI
jgi:hypothetical protein